jgi:hypothetical protein
MTAHAAGESIGASGLLVATGSKPADANTPKASPLMVERGDVGAAGAAEICSVAATLACDVHWARDDDTVGAGGAGR